MDYEKKYKEALERARAKYAMKDQPIHQDLVDIFPELAESVDERIRKEIIDFVKSRGGFKGDWIAWLEKQGKQKPAEWSEEDEEIHRRCICAMRASACGFPEEEKFVEQVDNWLKSFKDRVQPQPKQGWCGGDEAHLHSLITHLEQWIERHPNTTGADIQGENITWLKSLRPQSTWKPSDEQIKALNYVINLMASSESLKENDYYYNVFKGLREQLKKL